MLRMFNETTFKGQISQQAAFCHHFWGGLFGLTSQFLMVKNPSKFFMVKSSEISWNPQFFWRLFRWKVSWWKSHICGEIHGTSTFLSSQFRLFPRCVPKSTSVSRHRIGHGQRWAFRSEKNPRWPPSSHRPAAPERRRSWNTWWIQRMAPGHQWWDGLNATERYWAHQKIWYAYNILYILHGTGFLGHNLLFTGVWWSLFKGLTKLLDVGYFKIESVEVWGI